MQEFGYVLNEISQNIIEFQVFWVISLLFLLKIIL